MVQFVVVIFSVLPLPVLNTGTGNKLVFIKYSRLWNAMPRVELMAVHVKLPYGCHMALGESCHMAAIWQFAINVP
jgi:hypothetical protein